MEWIAWLSPPILSNFCPRQEGMPLGFGGMGAGLNRLNQVNELNKLAPRTDTDLHGRSPPCRLRNFRMVIGCAFKVTGGKGRRRVMSQFLVHSQIRARFRRFGKSDDTRVDDVLFRQRTSGARYTRYQTDRRRESPSNPALYSALLSAFLYSSDCCFHQLSQRVFAAGGSIIYTFVSDTWKLNASSR